MAAPIDRVRRRRAVFPFPPDIALIGECDVCEERVVLNRLHRVRIRFVTRPGHDAEISVLGIDRVKPSVRADLHPGDVVADRGDLPAFEMRGRNEHREICFAAGARERRGNVMLSAFGRFHSENEHMLILGVESPEGRKHYVAAAFPSACGKTNFAMLIPPAHFKGWKITTVGDDIAWMEIRDGRLFAVNPENGYFCVVPGTSYKSNPDAMKSIEHDTLYTNVALTDDGDVWWEGKDGAPPTHAIDWRGNDWMPESKEKAAHPNSRFATPMFNNPALDADVEKGEGVPISAIIFGGRRSNTMPLVFQAFDWNHGVYLGATMASETTAAATGAVGQVRRDPMAMLPFCGYNIGDYFQHWIDIGKRLTNPPLIFHVNWFRKGEDGKFLWPGFGDNMRVLKWIIDRCEQTGGAVKSPIGWLPSPHDLDLAELDVEHKCIVEILGIDHEEWQKELAAHAKFFDSLGGVVPDELLKQGEQLAERFEQ